MNLLIRSAIVIDKKSEFHNDKVDILIKNGIISNIARSIKNSNNYKKTNMRENVTYTLIKSGIIGLIKQMAFFYGKRR